MKSSWTSLYSFSTFLKYLHYNLAESHPTTTRPSKEELQEILEEIDEDGSGEIEFGEFCQLCAKFLVEEPDEETMKAELKEAFRVYDRDVVVEPKQF